MEAAENLGERQVGQCAVGEVEAVARDDLPAQVEGAVAQRGQETGLADAGVTGEQDGDPGGPDPGASLVGRDDAELDSEIVQLGISSHEGRCGDRGHAVHHVGSRRHQAAGFGR